MYTWPKSVSLTGRWLDIYHLFVCRIVSPLLNVFSGTFLIWHDFLHRYGGLCVCLGIVFPFDLLAKHKGFVLILLSLLMQILARFSNSSYSSLRSVCFWAMFVSPNYFCNNYFYVFKIHFYWGSLFFICFYPPVGLPSGVSQLCAFSLFLSNYKRPSWKEWKYKHMGGVSGIWMMWVSRIYL